MLSNEKIIEALLQKTGCDNYNQLADYLTEKYGIKITRQQINQFKKSTAVTITSLLLREAIIGE